MFAEPGAMIGAMESFVRDQASEARSDVTEQASPALAPVHELTARELDEQRRLVRASLLLGVG
jgi:hypothetical protein